MYVVAVDCCSLLRVDCTLFDVCGLLNVVVCYALFVAWWLFVFVGV